MTRTPVWKSIATTLESEIAQGHYRTGDKLPTEADLSARFGVNRHTIRHALGDMAERGILRSRRGSGVYVEAPPTEYPIGRRVRFHQNVRAAGQLPSRQALRREVRPCDEAEAQALDLDPGTEVMVFEGMSLSDDTPMALFTSVFPITRLPGIDKVLEEVNSVTEALHRVGIEDYTRAQTRFSAERASATQAILLRLREGDPILRTVSLNVDLNGVPVEHGITYFAGDRVTLSVTPE